ncbi:FAD-binding oxidoreductase [Mesorhizobium sp.]|uniref:FAD-binding oxidoreductase n=1 Tax=Mesorhizobium sp. TaxID=1871066 RepID=UPI0025EF043B|nr:FAD-binding oxidoreductase [Mesorhizobium sp.]
MESDIKLADVPILLQSAPLWMPTAIKEVRQVTPTIKALRFDVPWGDAFRAGQCIDFRLTAADGYTAQRYYSIATAPDASKTVEVMVERQEGGEVSTFFHDILELGDLLEVRGPIGGGPFTWQPSDPGPILLIGGGSGVVPLLSMVRHRQAVGSHTPFTLIYSAKTHDDILAREELLAAAADDPHLQLVITLTRESVIRPGFRIGRLTKEVVRSTLRGAWSRPETCFICGSNAFVGDMSDYLLEEGLEIHQVRTERFGG